MPLAAAQAGGHIGISPSPPAGSFFLPLLHVYVRREPVHDFPDDHIHWYRTDQEATVAAIPAG
jgi:hypothetical protein